MFNFYTGAFAIAGAAAAAGPIIIHLLNRRRFRTVRWAAMDFLQDAIKRNRRILELRDVLLLALRVACILCFGFALARPFLTAGGAGLFRDLWLWPVVFLAFASAIVAVVAAQRWLKTAALLICLAAAPLGMWGSYRAWNAPVAESAVTSSRHPVHAVLVIDNSQSMGWQAFEAGLLDRAKSRAVEFIDRLPAESRVTVIPLCGGEHAWSLDAHRSRQEAKRAVNEIEPVDRSGGVGRAVELAVDACRRVPELPAKRVVFLGDQQQSGWRDAQTSVGLADLPDVQIVPIQPDAAANVWASDFRVRDGVADAGSPVDFLARVQCEGPNALDNVEVRLTIAGEPAATRTISLQPGQTREVALQARIDVPVEPGRIAFVPAELSIETDRPEADRLKSDNSRYLAVPVAAGLTVVFVDQYGTDEDPERGQYGETYRLRRLLAPRSREADGLHTPVRIVHTTIDRLTVETLEEARLVVIAGVESPEVKTGLLREYVEQGGGLLIAAGGEFDPAAWTAAAWKNGRGVLPAPLKPQAFGRSLDETPPGEAIDPFALSFDTMQHEYFMIEGESREFLKGLYQTPVFVKAVEVDVSEPVLESLIAEETRRIEEERELAATDAEPTAGDNPVAESRPSWLTWGSSQDVMRKAPAQSNDSADADANSLIAAETLARRTRPQVRAAFQNDLPFLVERRIGDGTVLFVASAVYSDWNNLTQTSAVVMFERIVRNRLEATLPVRNFESEETITLPARRSDDVRYILTRPDDRTEPLSVDALGGERYGVTASNVFQSGVYTVTARRDGDNDEAGAAKLFETPIAVNAPVEESLPIYLDREGMTERVGDERFRWIGAGEPIALEGARIRGRDMWKLMIRIALGCLVVEMLIVAGGRKRAAVADSDGGVE